MDGSGLRIMGGQEQHARASLRSLRGSHLAMRQTINRRLHRALDGALERYAAVMAEPFPAGAALSVIETDVFVAQSHADRQGVVVTVSTGVVEDIQKLWQEAIGLSESLPATNRLNISVKDLDAAIDASLVWLMLHELHHQQIGHFDLVGSAGLSETQLPEGMGLTRRSRPSSTPFEALDKETGLYIRRCLELQADHDAQEILLGHFRYEEWGQVRFHSAAIMAMMVLIDQQDQASDEDREHPISATRIFQMFGALAYLWMPGSGSDWSAPEIEEIERYYEVVVIPAVSDAIILATAGKGRTRYHLL